MIRVFDPPKVDGDPFVIRGTILRPASVQWTENFYAGGRFDISLSPDAPYAMELQKGRFVLIDGCYPGYIEGVTFRADASGETLSVTGVNALGALGHRNVLPPLDGVSAWAGYDAQTGPTETLIKHYISANIGPAASFGRRAPGFRVADDLGRGIPDDHYAARNVPLSEVIEGLGKDAELGVMTLADLASGTITFDCSVGTDRSAEQSSVPPVVLELPRRNVLSMVYQDDDTPMRNVFYATMAGADYADEALTLSYWRDSEPTGLWRRETHINISVNTPTPGEEYSELRRLALIEAKNYEATQTFDCELNGQVAVYRKDFFLGDYVTVQNRTWGVSKKVQIVGMAVTVDASGKRYIGTFGTGKINPIALLKRNLINR